MYERNTRYSGVIQTEHKYTEKCKKYKGILRCWTTCSIEVYIM